MSQSSSELPSEREIDAFLESLWSSDLKMPAGWTFQPAAESEVSTGPTYLMIRWGTVGKGEVLKATFSYQLGDASPLVSLV